VSRLAVIGGGISGLTAAYTVTRNNPGIDVTVFESAGRLGGVIRTEYTQGCVIDAGPDSFLTIKRAASDLCRELELEDALVGSNDASRKTFILNDGRLKTIPEGLFLMIPTSPIPFIKTDLISWPGKLAAISDLFEQPEQTDCTVADFIEKRFGTEILQRIAEPMLAGIYGAGVSRLSLKSALPQLWDMQKKGSLVRQLLGHRASNSKESLFTTLSGGMETLVNRLVERTPVKWMTSTYVDAIRKKDGRWWIQDQAYEAVIIASSMLPEIQSAYGLRMCELLGSVRRNCAIVVVYGFGALQKEGFGWLVPATERRTVLACTYLTNKFSGRSPEGKFLVRLFIGGSNAAFWIDKSDDEILNEARLELDRIAGIREEPIFSRVFRWRHAMPEYAVMHEELMAEVEQLARQEQSLFLTGNLWSGVGMPDCIRHAQKTARDAAQWLSGASDVV
jgi:oxygen-dependent protoporphyrinogen oxidase